MAPKVPFHLFPHRSMFFFLLSFSQTIKVLFFSLHFTACGLGGTKELTVSSRNDEKKGFVGMLGQEGTEGESQQ